MDDTALTGKRQQLFTPATFVERYGDRCRWCSQWRPWRQLVALLWCGELDCAECWFRRESRRMAGAA